MKEGNVSNNKRIRDIPMIIFILFVESKLSRI